MKRLATLLLLMSFLSVASAQVGIVQGSSEPAIARVGSACNVSQSFLNALKSAILTEMEITGSVYSNFTNVYCYSYDDTGSVSFQLIIKNNKSDYKGTMVSGSLWTSELIDYDLLFTKEESNALSYILKQKYLDYYVNETDESYYVEITPSYETFDNRCDDLRSFYDDLSGEKYFNEGDYCSIITKTRTSEIKSLVGPGIGYVNYLGDDIRFHFYGYSEGNYDLASLSGSINCDLSTSNYYYPEFDSSCYGIYKSKSRVYFSTSNSSPDSNIYVSVYGYVNGKAKISASSYGSVSEQEVNDFVSKATNNYFNQAYSVNLIEYDYGLSGETIINNLVLDMNAFNELKFSERFMDKYYEGDGVYATISEPYIQVYVPESSSQDVMVSRSIMPYYWNKYFIITKSRVYSEITLNDSDSEVAVSKIKEFIDPYISTGDWSLNMTVTGSYYPIILYDYGMRAQTAEVGVATATSSLESYGLIGLSDSLSTQYPEIKELEEEPQPVDLWTLIVNFFKGLFRMN